MLAPSVSGNKPGVETKNHKFQLEAEPGRSTLLSVIMQYRKF